jgi:oligopeptide/dipeptide ABC transporter ATP-binding protein
MTSPVLEVRDLVKDYVSRDAKLRQRVVRAVDGVSFEVWPSETFAIVGESGSGKSTVGRVILKLTDATEGQVSLLGENILELGEKQFRPMRRNLQMVFQDPLAAFDPRATIRSSLREFAEFGGERTRSQEDQAIEDAIRNVGLAAEIADRRPAEVSGGQLQRLSVARSLLVEPRLLFLDEPTSSLDVSIRGQIVNLLTSLQETDQLAYLLVAHDLRVVYAMAHRVAVMYLGQFVEIGTRDQIYREAAHPYTRGLLEAAQLEEPGHAAEPVRLSGEISTDHLASPGCRLMPRCPFSEPRCAEPQPLRETRAGQLVRCWKAVEAPVSIGLPEPPSPGDRS